MRKYFDGKVAESKNNPKDFLRTLSMPSRRGGGSKISLKENDVVCVNSKKNAKTFYRFY